MTVPVGLMDGDGGMARPTTPATDTRDASISIIVPMLNERAALPELLSHLAALRGRGCEVWLVDGGSDDGSPELAIARGYPVLHSERGRARQMNAGAGAASGSILLFLHADTRLPGDADRLLVRALAMSGRIWGRFDVRIAGRSRWLILVATLMNWRSRLTGIATGDQAIFVRRDAFATVGGFPDQPLMEDIELARRLKRISRPLCIKTRATTSGRRWEARGVWRTILLMWSLRFAYWRGTSADSLAARYR